MLPARIDHVLIMDRSCRRYVSDLRCLLAIHGPVAFYEFTGYA